MVVPNRFWGGIIGAFVAALAGALLSGYLLRQPGISHANPPGVAAALWALPGSLAALAGSFLYGGRRVT